MVGVNLLYRRPLRKKKNEWNLFFFLQIYTRMSVNFQTSGDNCLSLPNYKPQKRNQYIDTWFSVSVFPSVFGLINLIQYQMLSYCLVQNWKIQNRLKYISIAPVVRMTGIWDHFLCFTFYISLTCVLSIWLFSYLFFFFGYSANDLIILLVFCWIH